MSFDIVKHEYNGFGFSQRADGYVNLTAMAKAGARVIADYLRLKGTKAYIAELSTVMQIPITELLIITQGGDGEQGTWGHVEIAVDLAQWVSVSFRIWANRTLKNTIQQKKVQPALSPEQSISVLTEAFKMFKLAESPRHLQLAQDRVAYLLSPQQPLLSGASEAQWSGVAEIAEQLGFNAYQISKVRSGLGRVVAAWYRGSENAEPVTEDRILNGRMCSIKVYQRTEELDDMIAAYLETKGLEAA